MPMFADYHRTVIGYHGTTRERALEIVSGTSTFARSKNTFDWLGHGIYFWEYAPLQAWAWAQRRYKDREIAVVASMIRLGNCLDLLDAQNARNLTQLYERYCQEMSTAGTTLPKNVKAHKYLDCAVMEYVYRTYGTGVVDTSRGVYVPSGGEKQTRLWKNSWLCHDTHIQLCVRNASCILGTWLVKRIGD